MTQLQTETRATHLPQKPLKEALETVLPFTGKKYAKNKGLETRGLESTVLLDFSVNELVFTDFVSFVSFPFKQYSEDLFSPPLKNRYLIHIESAKELKKALVKNGKNPVKLTSFRDVLTFYTDKGEIKVDLVEDTFPDYKHFLQEGWENKVSYEFQRDSLLHLVDNYTPSQGNVAIHISDTTEGKLYLSDLEEEGFSEGHYFNNYEGHNPNEGIKMGLNYSYFLSALKRQSSTTVNLIFRDPTYLTRKGWNKSAFHVKGSFSLYLAPLDIT